MGNITYKILSTNQNTDDEISFSPNAIYSYERLEKGVKTAEGQTSETMIRKGGSKVSVLDYSEWLEGVMSFIKNHNAEIKQAKKENSPVFEITDMREDSTFKYTKLFNGKTIDSGYMSYTSVSEDDLPEWNKAVKKYYKEKGKKLPTDYIHGYIDEIKQYMDTGDIYMPDYIKPELPGIPAALSGDPCELIPELIKAVKMGPPNLIKTVDALKVSTISNLEITDIRLSNGFVILTKNFMDKVLDTVEDFVDAKIGPYETAFEEIKKTAAKVLNDIKTAVDNGINIGKISVPASLPPDYMQKYGEYAFTKYFMNDSAFISPKETFLKLYNSIFKDIFKDKKVPELISLLTLIKTKCINYGSEQNWTKAGIWGIDRIKGMNMNLLSCKKPKYDSNNPYDYIITSKTDNRYDINESSKAVAKEFAKIKKSNREFNWIMDIIIYECGIDEVNNFIKKAEDDADVWKICQYAPTYVKDEIILLYIISDKLGIDASVLFSGDYIETNLESESNDSEENELTKRIGEELKKLGAKVVDIINKLLQFELILELILQLKNLYNTAKEVWEKIIAKLKAFKDSFKDKDFSDFLTILLPLLGAFLGAIFAFKANRETASDIKNLPYTTGDEEEDSKLIDSEFQKLITGPTEKTMNSEVIKMCNNEKFPDYSLSSFKDNLKEDNTNEKSDEKTICSMCPPDVSTDFDNLFASNPLKESVGIIIEFDKNSSYEISSDSSYIIKANDILGTIDNINVESKTDFIISDKQDNIIIGRYPDTNVNDIDINELLGKYNNDKLDDIVNLFNINASVSSFIKNYLIFTRMPDIVLKNAPLGGSIDKTLKDYIDEFDKSSEDFNNKIKEKCSKENIQSYVESDNMLGLKKEMDNEREEEFNRIIDFYNDYNSYALPNGGTISDYMMYNTYISYLSGDHFTYDDNNPFIVKMYNMINKFIGIRSSLEYNTETIDTVILQFETLCNDTIQYKWKPVEGYYTHLADKFKYEYYDGDTMTESSADAKNRTTLYNKIYNYIKTICNYTPSTANSAPTYTEGFDAMKFMEENQKSEEPQKDEFDENLKKIALKFVSTYILAKTVNTELVNSNFSNDTVKRYKSIATPLTNIYYDGIITADPVILGNMPLLHSFLEKLKAQAESESKEMAELANEVIIWYKENKDKINDPNIFNFMKTINWMNPVSVYYKNEKYDFYYLYNSSDKTEEDNKTEDSSNSSEPVVANGYDFYYGKSKYTVNDFEYWLKYMGIATLVNCMVPIYWATGFLVSGAPVLLPIIHIPVFVIPGTVTVVLGIGLCGIIPMPMILFVNMSNTVASILIPLNMAIDAIKNILKTTISNQTKLTEKMLEPIIKSLDNEINKYKNEIDSINDKIYNIKNIIKDNIPLKQLIDKKTGRDTTGKAK